MAAQVVVKELSYEEAAMMLEDAEIHQKTDLGAATYTVARRKAGELFGVLTTVDGRAALLT